MGDGPLRIFAVQELSEIEEKGEGFENGKLTVTPWAAFDLEVAITTEKRLPLFEYERC